jgi:uncharacterized protein (TIGR03067 family)
MHSSIVCSSLVLLLSFAGRAPAGETVGKALADLQGTWKLVSMERDGEKQPEAITQGQPAWLIKGNKVSRHGQEFGLLTVHTETTPRAIDLKLRSPAKVYEGIYAVEKNTLKVCFQAQTEGVKDRPSKLATEGQPSWRLLVFERTKAGAEPDKVSGFIGMAIRKEGEKLAVAMVFPGSPGEKAGLKKDDILLRIAGEEPGGLRETVRAISQHEPGSNLVIRVLRDGKQRDIAVKMGVIPFFLLD